MGRVEGGCLCGRVRLEARGRPLRVAVCHCLDCRKHHGAVFYAAAIFPKAAVSVTGATGAFRGRSGGGTSARSAGRRCLRSAGTRWRCIWARWTQPACSRRSMRLGWCGGSRGCRSFRGVCGMSGSGRGEGKDLGTLPHSRHQHRLFRIGRACSPEHQTAGDKIPAEEPRRGEDNGDERGDGDEGLKGQAQHAQYGCARSREDHRCQQYDCRNQAGCKPPEHACRENREYGEQRHPARDPKCEKLAAMTKTRHTLPDREDGVGAHACTVSLPTAPPSCPSPRRFPRHPPRPGRRPRPSSGAASGSPW